MSVSTWSNLSKPASAETTSAVKSFAKIPASNPSGTSAIESLRTKIALVGNDVNAVRDEISRVDKALDRMNGVLKTVVEDIKQLKDISKDLVAGQALSLERTADTTSKVAAKVDSLSGVVSELSDVVEGLKSAKLDGGALEQLQSEVSEIKAVIIEQLFPDAGAEVAQ